jgi:TolA protein
MSNDENQTTNNSDTPNALLSELKAKAKAKAERKTRVSVKNLTGDEKERSKYIQIIANKISKNWYRPPSARNNMRTVLKIKLTPAGKVQYVQILDTSGNRAFDLSAKEAILKSEFPEIQNLPLSTFEKDFREFNIHFIPQDLQLLIHE